MSISFSELLANTLLPVQQVREEAIAKLEAYSAESFPSYLSMLCQELASEASPSHIRKSAGLMLKNALSARQQGRKDELANRWVQTVDATVKESIKSSVLQTLGSADSSSGTVAAQVIAAIADIELPLNMWPQLITTLLQHSSSDNKNMKQAALQTIGFICETVDPDILSAHSNAILTAVANGARPEESSMTVRLAAIQALYNSLEFVKDNFERDTERNYIMQMICESTEAANPDIQVVAFECLVRVMNLYYEKMGIYMQQALFQLTIKAMKDANDRIAMQAIEFWSSICEIEFEIALDNIEAQDMQEPLQPTYNFVSAACKELVPVLLFLLTKKEEDDDEDEFNVPMASATCLGLLAQVAGDIVVEPVLSFIQTNINHPQDWRYREASVMAFGSILDGPSVAVLGPMVSPSLPSLVPLMKDPVIHIRDSTAWTLGRICEILAEYMTPDDRAAVISVALEGLQDASRVAVSCAWCLSNLAESLASDDLDSEFPLVPFFDTMVSTLMTAAEKRSQDSIFSATAYNAIASLVSGANRQCFESIKNIAMNTLMRLTQTITMHSQLVGADDRRLLYELQSNLCSVLVSVTRRLGSEIRPISDQMVESLISIMSTAAKSSNVLEDAFLAMGAIATAIEGDFLGYMNAFIPYLHNALANHEEHQMCSIAIGLVGDICRALNERIAPYCGPIMELLMQDLRSETAKPDIKPSILSCFGDVALAIGGQFELYLSPIMTALSQAAASAQSITEESEMFDYSISLREGVVEACVGITQGLKSGGKADILLQYVQFMFGFCEAFAAVELRTDSATRGLVGLVGDLADSFPHGQLKPLFYSAWIDKLLMEVKTSAQCSIQTKEVGKWAREMVKRQIST